MIRYTVVWHQEAQDQLTNIWLDASERDSVALAANAIDRHLITDATEKGVQNRAEPVSEIPGYTGKTLLY